MRAIATQKRMLRRTPLLRLPVGCVLLLLGGCIAMKQYHLCVPECELEQGSGYRLAYIEMDDQGSFWDDRQLALVLDQIQRNSSDRDRPRGTLVVTFVHGWKHNADPGDGNVETARRVLQRLAASEAEYRSDWREILGVYVGWRGDSVRLPLARELTFWGRKRAANQVGLGDAGRVMDELDRAVTASNETLPDDVAKSRLIVLGHSFGGAIVHNATYRIFVERLVQTCEQCSVRGFGSLVVLLNPAFEASRFAPLHRLALQKNFTIKEGQKPLLLVLTSRSDWATKVAFPLGRSLATLFDAYRDPTSRKGDRSALGHFEGFLSHELDPVSAESLPLTATRGALSRDNISTYRQEARQKLCSEEDSLVLGEVELTRRNAAAGGCTPFLNVSVDKTIMDGHGDFYNDRVSGFIEQFVELFMESERTAMY